MTETIGRVFNNRYQPTVERTSASVAVWQRCTGRRQRAWPSGRREGHAAQYAADPNFTQRFKQDAAAANLQSPRS